ncbi:hypothetical protein AGMMS49965_03470 [Bacteroidia bacterium]|nr:hypothetical protein AGMMS49965_03470 [Bacteroidia bacterium]
MDKDIIVYPDPLKEVIFLFPANSLGDMGYNDYILKSVLDAQKNTDFDFHYINPQTNSTAELKSVFDYWLNYVRENADALLLLGSCDDYENFVVAESTADEPVVNRILIFESERDLPVRTVSFSGYGVSFLIGAVAYEKTQAATSAYVSAFPDWNFLNSGRDGFTDGYTYAAAQSGVTAHVSAMSLATGFDGFNMVDSTYRVASALYAESPFIYALAGTSNLGIYRYLRETNNPNLYTVGVDTDQSPFAKGIIGSMLKRMDLWLPAYIQEWLQTGQLPASAQFDLSSGYIHLLLAASYSSELQPIVEQYHGIAQQKELEYLNSK